MAKLSRDSSVLQRAGKGRALGTASVQEKGTPKRTRTSPTQPASVRPQPWLPRADVDLLRPPSEQWTSPEQLIAAAHAGPLQSSAPVETKRPVVDDASSQASHSLCSLSSGALSLHTPTPEAGGPATCLSLSGSMGFPEDRGSNSLSSSATDVAARVPPPAVMIQSLPAISNWADDDRADYYARRAAMKAEHAYSCQQVYDNSVHQQPEMMDTWAWSVLSSIAGRFTHRARSAVPVP